MTHTPGSITRFAVAAILCTGTAAFAGSHNTAFTHSAIAADNRPSHVRVVAGDRQAASNVRIVINESISTRVDTRRLAVSSDLHIDENHSLLRAARVHNSLSGVTTNELAAVRNAMVAKPSMGNRAFVVTGAPARTAPRMDAVEVIRAKQAPRIQVKPKRKSVPIPSVPKPNKSADGDEKIASVLTNYAGGDEA